MSWTTPKTWNVGEVLTASNMNIQLRDNMNFLNADSNVLTTTGDLLYASAANVLARLGIGGSTQVLGSNGTIPQWTTPTATTLLSLFTTYSYTIPNAYTSLPFSVTSGQVLMWFLLTDNGTGPSAFGLQNNIGGTPQFAGASNSLDFSWSGNTLQLQDHFSGGPWTAHGGYARIY